VHSSRHSKMRGRQKCFAMYRPDSKWSTGPVETAVSAGLCEYIAMRHVAACGEHLNWHFVYIVGPAQQGTVYSKTSIRCVLKNDACSTARICDKTAMKWIALKTRWSSSVCRGQSSFNGNQSSGATNYQTLLPDDPSRLRMTCQVHSFRKLGSISC
jgi:hypothetical protein